MCAGTASNIIWGFFFIKGFLDMTQSLELKNLKMYLRYVQ